MARKGRRFSTIDRCARTIRIEETKSEWSARRFSICSLLSLSFSLSLPPSPPLSFSLSLCLFVFSVHGEKQTTLWSGRERRKRDSGVRPFRVPRCGPVRHTRPFGNSTYCHSEGGGGGTRRGEHSPFSPTGIFNGHSFRRSDPRTFSRMIHPDDERGINSSRRDDQSRAKIRRDRSVDLIPFRDQGITPVKNRESREKSRYRFPRC